LSQKRSSAAFFIKVKLREDVCQEKIVVTKPLAVTKKSTGCHLAPSGTPRQGATRDQTRKSARSAKKPKRESGDSKLAIHTAGIVKALERKLGFSIVIERSGVVTDAKR
jgi:hypothetical protein